MRLDQEAGEFVKFQQGFQCPDNADEATLERWAEELYAIRIKIE